MPNVPSYSQFYHCTIAQNYIHRSSTHVLLPIVPSHPQQSYPCSIAQRTITSTILPMYYCSTYYHIDSSSIDVLLPNTPSHPQFCRCTFAQRTITLTVLPMYYNCPTYHHTHSTITLTVLPMYHNCPTYHHIHSSIYCLVLPSSARKSTQMRWRSATGKKHRELTSNFWSHSSHVDRSRFPWPGVLRTKVVNSFRVIFFNSNGLQ